MVYFTELSGIENACCQIEGDEQKLKENTEELRKWLNSQKHLPENGVDENLLEKFVLGGKGDLSKSKLKLDTYFSVRNILTDVYSKRDPLDPEILQSNDYMYMGILPGLTPDGARVLVVAPKNKDPTNFELRPTVVRTFNIFDVWLRTDPHNNKLYVLTDATNGTIGHMMKISISLMKHTIFCLQASVYPLSYSADDSSKHEASYWELKYQNVYPISVLGLIFLNMIPFVRVLVEKGLKPLFKKKLAKRFMMFGEDLSGLHEKIPQAMLPKEYGGNGPSLEELNQSWIDIINENRDWLMTSASIPFDESIREGKRPYSGAGCSVM